MYAIASLLDPYSDQAVRSLWEHFERSCGLTSVQMAPLPHFSWQGADGYQAAPVEAVLSQSAAQIAPFRVRTAGLGIFTGPKPVVYIPLVKDALLMQVHQMLWEQTRPYAIVPNLYYEPSHWMPHITLALHEADSWRLACAVEEIAEKRIEFEIIVDNFAVIFQMDGKAGMRSRFAFQENIHHMGGLR